MRQRAYSSNTPQSGFTLVELIVAASILAILTTIGFYSYTQNINTARDSVRQTDISSLGAQLKLYKRQRWAYPLPWDFFNIHNRWQTVAYQWFMNQNVNLSTADSLPTDPELEIPYFYSITTNKQEYQLTASMENDGSPYAFIGWDYKSVAKNILPNILLAIESNSAIEINEAETATDWDENRKLFIFHKWFNTLPYDFESGNPASDGADFDTLVFNASEDYWQNSDYRSCEEINTAGKNITQTWSIDEYQLLNSTGALIDTDCPGIL